MIRKFIVLGVLVLMALPYSVSAETLNITQFLSEIEKNDVEYKNLLSNSRLLKGNLKAAKSIDDWRFNTEISKSYVQQMNQGGMTIDGISGWNADVGVSRKISKTGTSVAMGYQYEKSSLTMNFGAPTLYNLYKPGFYLTVSQPILKNFMGKLDQYPLESLGFLKRIYQYQDEDKTEAYYDQNISLYFDWIYATKAIKLTARHYDNLLVLHDQVKRQYKDDFLNKTDLLRSQEMLVKLGDVLENQLENWNVLAEMISSKMGKSFLHASSWNALPIEPDLFSILDPSQGIGELRVNGIYQTMLSSLARDKAYIEEQSRIGLDTFVSYSAYDADTTNIGYVGNPDKSDCVVGFKMTADLGQSSTAGQKQTKEEEIAKTELEWKKIKREIKSQRKRLNRMLMLNKRSQDYYGKIVDWSSERLDQEIERYNTGKVPYKTVVDTQFEVLDNKIKQLEYKINGEKLMINKLSLEDQLLKNLAQIKKEG